MTRVSQFQFNTLRARFEGELYFDNSTLHTAQRTVYATDASVYQEMPVAVALPKTVEDIRALIDFAQTNKVTLIPRAAGTSLAGQVVGKGVVVDISKHFRQIIEVNADEKWVRVQPGVIRDDLNKHLAPYGLLFGPETSTASRAMIGGMIGNNSCGLHSITWGATRDHLLEVKVLLSDGSEAVFSEQTIADFTKEIREKQLKGQRLQSILAGMFGLISNPIDQDLIKKQFPKPTVTRRNSGYALDALVRNFEKGNINLCNLIAGSEGTLCFVTEAKIALVDAPPAAVGVVCVHTGSLAEALHANRVAMQHDPKASELVDKYIMDFTKNHNVYSQNRFFMQGDPAAMLMVEFWGVAKEEVEQKVAALIAQLQAENLGYAYPLLFGDDANKAWDIRKAGLGLIRNLPGDTQPVNLIEDCAVAVEDLPAYIEELEVLLHKHGLSASYYAHAGAGELHVEPMINLKTSEGKQQFRDVLADTAVLVKKYNGALSGEHGDGRLRGEFIPFMMGEEVYEMFRQVKRIWDPDGVFNANKIVDTPPMNEFLRYGQDKPNPQIETIFDFSRQEGILRLAEKCSGSGDCRKTELTGGTMCPSYMATRSERDTTRARANILRQYLTPETAPATSQEMVKEVLDLCLSCKGCKSECPSSVDIGKMKAEFTQQYYETHGVPLRSKLIAQFSNQMKLASIAPWAFNGIFGTPALRRIANKMVGFHPERSMPKLDAETLKSWWEKHQRNKPAVAPHSRRVYLFCDEFTNYNDAEVGKKAVLLLEKLGYEVIIPEHLESGRSYLSKGFVKEAQKLAIRNVALLKDKITYDAPLVGIEPSAILSFRDEYVDLVGENERGNAQKVAENALLFEEFVAREMDAKRIQKSAFVGKNQLIKLHGHCHQKALSTLTASKKALQLPENYHVQLIPSGCCGMAGSFGYEEEHFEVSMQIGELVLFPTVRQQPEEVIIAAAGTSCRHQIKDGTGRKAMHPVEILYDALIK
ncbi:FAD/FMN-containing dehydrogenase/Fe-S oxidoreductase [Dyadobacter sp. BE34]|uniref:FAD/FMN-containing dehydrogenase/Fe-S oxidoreductase n=1 Tax=Dyadobacter fermentans TaxID=94254 RepID=A0ABU1R6Y1_9BACT|nr:MULTISPECIES: FAD-linked oxidase C-terminal domain-containing protein [Dyadobacter]MDR6808345.1 FAD/FMN-containing dehydrogenase/Fe-S oxidoreductase [Dyadobacter fermentans]MDR7045838.1 FAD/FMN-containing dehydrogenase/Fe-S oxidoreductase [Dyadobacter sp. BE242]MDR7200151.1 FAD/FMN-containing dehydrogenase/Fe-S oxidoreductase [Dyadobacter sp. BE34]MDR7218111.1 FAD/FMN-containing dehydrogenase/Fe-S oxidoreductase [Dyadobacter sp. BE31]MDR7266042.1 FAD/FMN-containing dehydrogenase/Fe-S oxidor